MLSVFKAMGYLSNGDITSRTLSRLLPPVAVHDSQTNANS